MCFKDKFHLIFSSVKLPFLRQRHSRVFSLTPHQRQQRLNIPSHRRATGVITELLSSTTADHRRSGHAGVSLASILPSVCSRSEARAPGQAPSQHTFIELIHLGDGKVQISPQFKPQRTRRPVQSADWGGPDGERAERRPPTSPLTRSLIQDAAGCITILHKPAFFLAPRVQICPSTVCQELAAAGVSLQAALWYTA